MVTPKGANYLTVAGEPPEANTEIDVNGWETVPSLVSQGLLAEIPEVLNAAPSLPEDFPLKGVLESAGHSSLEAVHFLTDRQLIDLPEIGEAAVRDIRSAVAVFRGEEVLTKDEIKLSDVLDDSEIELVRVSRGEQKIEYAPPTDTSTEGIKVGKALGSIVEALGQVGFLELHCTRGEVYVLRLTRADIDPAPILAAINAEDAPLTLSEPLTRLLERLGLSYPPPAPAVPADGEVPPPAELQHPTSDSEKEAEQVKAEEKTPSSRGKNTAKPKA